MLDWRHTLVLDWLRSALASPRSATVSIIEWQIEFRLRSDPDFYTYTCCSLQTNPQNRVLHLAGRRGQAMTKMPDDVRGVAASSAQKSTLHTLISKGQNITHMVAVLVTPSWCRGPYSTK